MSSMPMLLAANQGLTDLEQKLIVALISAIIGAGATLLVHVLKARAEPRKRISWDATTDPAFSAIADPAIQQKLNITYDSVDVKNIFSLKYDVTNTGNRVIKDQRFRFRFPNGTRILETYMSPAPEPEFKVELEPSPDSQHVTYKIGHLERDQEVHFRFVVAGESADPWDAVPSNEEGDVVIEKKGSAQKKEDRAHIAPFLVSMFLFLTVPITLGTVLIDEAVSDALSTIARITLLVYALFHVAPVARTIRDTVGKVGSNRTADTYNASAVEGGSIVVVGSGGNINGRVMFAPPGD
ncbi:hypothetical protein ACFY7Y_06175 [Streptomyces virginiae]|uniref:hypothetical protein n=1 Tax=Streptomyces virginiae TaxID=1961 RepID=UPI0036CEB6E3